MEKSLDYRLFLVFELTNFILLIFSGSLTLQIELLSVGFVFSLILIVSLVHRYKHGWKVKIIGGRRALKSLLIFFVILGVILVVSMVFNFINNILFPWISGAVGILLYDLLKQLNIVSEYESEFQSHCDERSNQNV